MVETVSEARKALVKAIWSCIVDASSMNVVMSGPEVNAAMDGYRAAVLRELREEVAGLRHGTVIHDGIDRLTVLGAIDRRLDLIPSGGIAADTPEA